MGWRPCRPSAIRTTRVCAASLRCLPGSAFRLDDTFALHPSLSFLAQQWQAKQLAVVHAVSTPYRERSHFDAQDVLETGFARAHASRSGWLNRALPGLPDAKSTARKTAGVALGANVPLVMRGEVEVASWSPESHARCG